MARNPYGSYRGRASWGKRILIGIVVLLVIALILAVVGVVFLRDNIVYTDHGIEFTLPFGKKEPTSTESVDPSPLPTESELVIETPTPSPSPSPTAKPVMYPRRDTPLGLVPYGEETVLGSNQGAIFDMTEASLTDGEGIRSQNLGLPYAAAYLRCGADGGEDEDFLARCQTLAGLGFDELVLDPTDRDTAKADVLAGLYTKAKEALDELGYQGRLSCVCGRAAFTDETMTAELLPTLALRVERVYAAAGESWSGLNIYRTLKDLEFSGTQRDIVTVARSPLPSATYAWAVLP